MCGEGVGGGVRGATEGRAIEPLWGGYDNGRNDNNIGGKMHRLLVRKGVALAAAAMLTLTACGDDATETEQVADAVTEAESVAEESPTAEGIVNARGNANTRRDADAGAEPEP